MAIDSMIRAEGLKKRFGQTVALAGVDLDVPTGSILGVLGPNGAGKTTAVRILTTLSQPDAGSAWVAGHDVVHEAPAVQRNIGVTAQDATVDELLTGRQNLVMVGRLCGLRRAEARARADELLAQFDLTDAADRVAQGLLGRDAPPARPGRRTGHPTAGALPRRAHHRARPHQPGPDVGGDPGAGGRGGDPAAHHPVPRRGRRAGRQDRGHRPRPGHRRRDAGRAQSGHRRGPAGGHPQQPPESGAVGPRTLRGRAGPRQPRRAAAAGAGAERFRPGHHRGAGPGCRRYQRRRRRGPSALARRRLLLPYRPSHRTGRVREPVDHSDDRPPGRSGDTGSAPELEAARS